LQRKTRIRDSQYFGGAAQRHQKLWRDAQNTVVVGGFAAESGK